MPKPGHLDFELTILLPCLNEAATVSACIASAARFLVRSGINGEILVADNGSTDNSGTLAFEAGARVVSVRQRGYGAAILGGIEAAWGRYVIVGDADQSYDFENLDAFVERLRAGDALVVGNRFAGGVYAGAMPFLHRYLGNPVLSFAGRLLFGSPLRDFHCGLRGFSRDAVLALGLRSNGMEFASEMIVRATIAGLRISEVATTLKPDGRDGPAHLRTWRDGWRHLRFLLLMSPRWSLLYPGAVTLCVGIAAQVVLLSGHVTVSGVGFGVHTLLYAAAATLLGLQLIVFSVLGRVVGCLKGVLGLSGWLCRLLSVFTLERGIGVGVTIAAAGLLLTVHSVQVWMETGFAALSPESMMRTTIPAITLLIAGTETIFASLVLGMADLTSLPGTLGTDPADNRESASDRVHGKLGP